MPAFKAKWGINRQFLLYLVIIFIFLACTIGSSYLGMVWMLKKEVSQTGQEVAENLSSRLQKVMYEGANNVSTVLTDVKRMLLQEATDAEYQEYVDTMTMLLREQYPEYTGIYFEVDGTFYEGIPDYNVKEDPSFVASSRQWYQAAVANPDSIVLVSPYIDWATHKVVVTLSHYDSASNIVIGLDVELEVLQNHLDNMLIGALGTVYVTDGEGEIIISTHKEWIGVNLREEQEGLTPGLVPAYLRVEEAIGDLGMETQGKISAKIDGEDYEIVYKTTPNYWRILVLFHEQSIYSVLYVALIWEVIAGICFLLLVAALFAYNNYNRLRAEKATSVKERFMANISQEIREPMNEVNEMAKLLHDTPMDDTTKEYTRNLTSASSELMQVLTNILDLSELEKGTMHLHKDPIAFREFIDHILETVSATKKPKVELIWNIESTVPSMIVGDEKRLQRIFEKLASNAVKYTEEGYIKLDFRYRKMPDGKAKMYCSIEDTGSGIEESIRNRLFDPFAEAEYGDSDELGGPGLGLAVCRGILLLMNGDLKVSGRKGEGTIFEIIFETIQN